MTVVSDFVVSILAAYGVTFACAFVLNRFRITNALLWWLLGLPVFACPLMIPSNCIVALAFACLICVDVWFKICDLARVIRRSGSTQISFDQSLRFLLIPFPALQAVYGRHQRRIAPQKDIEVFRVLLGCVLVLSVLWLVSVIATWQFIQSSFVLDHSVKLVLFVLTAESASQILLGLERLAGYDTTPIIRFAFLSRTVGEFWCRYNTRVHAWLQHNVFLPCGGKHSPVRGLFLTFFVSALFHELGFGIATSRFDGTQFAFFMLQVPAVMLSQRIQRTRFGKVTRITSRAVTIGWFWLSSILFFHGFNRVFPIFYASTPWLP